MISLLCKALLSILGWKIRGRPPLELSKAVIIVMPHTSSLDFPLGLLVRGSLGIPVQFIGKKSLFRPPFGWLFRLLGGHPVDRSRPGRLVDQIVELFNNHDHFLLAIAPEGTRQKVDRIKTGFYYIAVGADVPIVMVRFDYRQQSVTFAEPLFPEGNKDRDMSFILDYFRGVEGKNPELGIDEYTTY